MAEFLVPNEGDLCAFYKMKRHFSEGYFEREKADD